MVKNYLLVSFMFVLGITIHTAVYFNFSLKVEMSGSCWQKHLAYLKPKFVFVTRES